MQPIQPNKKQIILNLCFCCSNIFELLLDDNFENYVLPFLVRFVKLIYFLLLTTSLRKRHSRNLILDYHGMYRQTHRNIFQSHRKGRKYC